MDVYGAMLLLTNLLTTLSRYIPGMPWVDNQEVAVFMFNATLGARDFTVSGDYFYQVTLNWTPQQQAAFKLDAMQYFEEKFGLTNPERNSKLITQLVSTNPDAGTRCYVLDGEVVPDEGFIVQDGQWMIVVNDTQGITLGGEFQGIHVQFGTTFAFGHWLIVKNVADRLLWKIKHAAPGIVATVGQGRTSNGEIDVYSDSYGHGKSFNIAKYVFDRTGNANAIYRNVITF